MTPQQRNLDLLAIDLLSLNPAKTRMQVDALATEERAYVEQRSAEISRACESLAAVAGFGVSYETAVNAVARVAQSGAVIADFVQR